MKANHEWQPGHSRCTHCGQHRQRADGTPCVVVLRKLIEGWREKSANEPMPTDRAIGLDTCANELEALIGAAE